MNTSLGTAIVGHGSLQDFKRARAPEIFKLTRQVLPASHNMGQRLRVEASNALLPAVVDRQSDRLAEA